VKAAAVGGRTLRVRGLDGVRGVAIAAVLAYHAFPGAAPGGFFGVEVFFVLSGFLLTSLLVDEHRRTGRISFERYAKRRVARVVPALVVALLGVALAARYLVPEDAHRVPVDALTSLTGFTNWHLIQEGTSYFRELGRPSLVRHLWSLAIEMQFYVLCPFVVAALVRRRRRTAVALLAAAIAVSAIAMGVLSGGADDSRAYFGTDTRIGALLTGMLLAFVLAARSTDARDRSAVHPRRLGMAGFAVLLALVLLAGDQGRFLYPAGFLLCRLATVGLIVAAGTPSRVAAALSLRPLRWLGQRSYGIYLWHWPIAAVTRPGIDVSWSPWVAHTAIIIGACVLGELSYRVVEAPFLRTRHYRSPTVASRTASLRWSAVGAALTVMAMIAAYLPTTDPIADSLRLGEQVVASQARPTTTAQPVTATVPADPAPDEQDTSAVDIPPRALVIRPRTTVPSPPPTTAPRPTNMQAPPAAAVPTTALGDSVMLGAAGPLQARLGGNAFIDAKVSRQFADGVGQARRLRDQGRLGQVVFVHLGSNGPPRASDIDALMEVLVDVPHVRFVNVRVNRNWEGPTNQTLADGAARHGPKVQLVDWYGFSAGHLDWFQSDGTHVKAPGAAAYADLLGSYLPPPPPPPPPPPETTTSTAPPPPETTTTTPAPPPATPPPSEPVDG
jgi:peptidoglycan/LPS O-acetylase OafA/YrhL